MSKIQDLMRISKIVNEEKDKDEQCSSSSFKKETKNVQERGGDAVEDFVIFFREREHLLSRFVADRTVGFRRSKKQSCSTRRELRVGTDFVEF